MAASAFHADHAVPFRASRYGWLVGDHLHSLSRNISVWMAIGTAGMEQHTASFQEQHSRTLFPLRDDREIRNSTQLVARNGS